MEQITLGIDGMACGMCEAHINDVVRNNFPVKKVTSSRQKKQTVILTEKPIDLDHLKEVVDQTGYQVVSVKTAPYEKKGWFFHKNG